MKGLDEKDRHLLNLLQENCRMTLTDLSKHLDLSVDSTKKRLNKLMQARLFFPRIQIRPRQLGYRYIVDVKIKLHQYSNEQLQIFVKYLNEHPRVAELFSISGEWDFTIVLIAKDHEDLARLGDEIRNEFSNIINDWQESLTKVAYKFERYDLQRLQEYEDNISGNKG